MKLHLLVASLPIILAGVNAAGDRSGEDPEIAKVVIVDFDKCNWRATKENFYRSIWVSESLYRHNGGTSHWYAGNSVGAWIKNGNYAAAKRWTGIGKKYGSWQRLDLGVDVTQVTNPDDLIYHLDFFGGVGQIYIPILFTTEGNMNDGYAQMLHIYNDDYTFNGGQKPARTLGGVKMWESTSTGNDKRRSFSVNMTGILEELKGDSLTADIRTHIKQTGTSSVGAPDSKRNTIYWSDYSYSGEKLCSYSGEKKPSDKELFREKMRQTWKIVNKLWGLKP